MSEVHYNAEKVAGDWDAYWRNARSAAAHKDGGPQDEVLEQFWLALFKTVFPTLAAEPGMLDIASGNGAVVRFALASAHSLGAGVDLRIYGLDESPAALEEMRNRYTAVKCCAADALHLPFRDAAFDLVTSQFGMEYAGSGVFAEVARLVAPGGVLAAVLHLHGGGIYRECAVNLAAIEGFAQSGIFDCFAGIFRAAQSAQQAGGDQALFRRADKKFATAVAAAEGVLQRCGKRVADGVLLRLYTDIAHMYRRFASYEPREVFAWIDLTAAELDSYAGRMASMLGAALDEAALKQAVAELSASGFTMRIQDILYMGRPSFPAAWVIIAERPRSDSH